MSPLHWIAFGAWLNLLGAWLMILYQQRQLKTGRLLVDETAADPSAAHFIPRVCIVVPAHNEEQTLEQCINSVLAQRGCDVVVRIIDDRSTDGTFDIAQRLASKTSRVSVHRINSLPDGWLGKSHALWQGTRDVDADWLLFLDADCLLLSPHAARIAVREAIRRQAELLSLWPSQAPGGFWERLLIPLCSAMIAMWYGSPTINNPNSARAFANGQFLLIRRDRYEAVGGHAAVRDALIEDIPLAEHAKRCGVACFAIGGPDLVSVRMYRSFSEIWRGWSRIYVGAMRSGLKLLLTFLWLAVGSLLPFAVLPSALIAIVTTPEHADISLSALSVLAMSAIHIILIMLVSWRFWGAGRCDRHFLWLYPASVVIVAGIVLQAFWWLVVRQQVGWRLNTYTIDRRARLKTMAHTNTTSSP